MTDAPLRQRDPRIKDRIHLDFVRGQPCCVCGSMRNVEAAHLRMRKPEIGKDTGMGEKPHDAFVTPLCAYHHRTSIQAQHAVGEHRFWFEIHSHNPFEIAARLWRESGGEERAAQPKPPKKPRPIKARKPRAMRKKIPAGRPMQSRNTLERSPQP